MKRFKRKFFPPITFDISNDELHYHNDDIMVTSWIPENSDMGVAKAVSVFFLKEGFQISKKFDKKGNFLYWYCDIIAIEQNTQENSITFVDLIADVVVLPNGQVELIDLDEFADAIEKNIIEREYIAQAVRSMHNLLEYIYKQDFPPKNAKKYFK